MSFERTGKQGHDIHHQHDDWDEVHNQLLSIQKKSLAVSDPNDANEKEADAVASKVVNGESALVHGKSESINRKADPEKKAQLEADFQAFKAWKLKDIQAKHKEGKVSREEKKFNADADQFEKEMRPGVDENYWGEAQYDEAMSTKEFLQGYAGYLDAKITETKNSAASQIATNINNLVDIQSKLNESITAMQVNGVSPTQQLANVQQSVDDLKTDKTTKVASIHGLENEINQDPVEREDYSSDYDAVIKQYDALIKLISASPGYLSDKALQENLGIVDVRIGELNTLKKQFEEATTASAVKQLFDVNLHDDLQKVSKAVADATTATQNIKTNPGDQEKFANTQTEIGKEGTEVKNFAAAEEKNLGLTKENRSRLTGLLGKGIDNRAKIIAAITLAEGAMKETQDITKQGGMKDISWVYRNFSLKGKTDREGEDFDKSMRRSTAYKDKQGHCLYWLVYFGAYDPITKQPFTSDLKYGETTKQIGLDILEYVARDVWHTTAESIVKKNPISTFTNQGYYNDLRHNDQLWFTARRFLYLWLLGRNGDSRGMNSSGLPYVSENEFNSKMKIVGDHAGLRTFLFNSPGIISFLDTLDKSASPPTSNVPDITYNEDAWEPSGKGNIPVKIDDKPVIVRDDMSLFRVLVEGKKVHFEGTPVPADAGGDATTLGKPTMQYGHLALADGKEVLGNDPRVKVGDKQQPVSGKLTVFNGRLYVHEGPWNYRLEGLSVTELTIGGMNIDKTW